MLYHPPVGGAANDPYVDYNGTAGTQGSKVPGKAIEYPQRELVNLQIEAGLVPTDTDLKQVMRSVRSGRLSFYQDGGTPNALILTSLTAHTSYVPGMPLCIKLANAITGATTLNLDNLGVLSVVYPGGGPLQRYDFLAGDLLVGRVNGAGTAFVVLSPISQLTIDGAVVKSVHGSGADFTDLNAAFAWLNRRRIASTGTVTFQLAAGVNANKLVYTADISFQHPDGQRVTVQGQPLAGVLPAPTALVCSGNTASNRLSDTTSNLATLRGAYSTEISFQGGHGFRGAGFLGNLQDILFTCDGSGAVDGFNWAIGFATLTRVSVVGATARGIVAGAAFLALSGNCYALGCAANGFSIENASVCSFNLNAQAIAYGNGQCGFFAIFSRVASPVANGATLAACGNVLNGLRAYGSQVNLLPASFTNQNGTEGCLIASASTLGADGMSSSNNGTAGFASVGATYVSVQNTTGSGNGTFGYYALNEAAMTRTGGTCTGASGAASPAVGSTGNVNSIIV